MSDIEMGEYIRTKKGRIGRIIKIWDKEFKNDRVSYLIDWGNGKGNYISQIKEIKHSKNIIDLIKVGDYIGNCEIQYIHKNEKGETLLENDDVTLTEKDIETSIIVTKERFVEVGYRTNE